jgi:hypothetical protein
VDYAPAAAEAKPYTLHSSAVVRHWKDTDIRQCSKWGADFADTITVTVTVANNLYFRNAARTTVWSLESPQQTILKEAAVLFPRTRRLQVRRADVERESSARVSVRGCVGFLTARDSLRELNYVGAGALWETYRGIWKNMRAFGFASFCCTGGCCCRFHMSPKSLPRSGTNGRTVGFIEPSKYKNAQTKKR